METFVSRNLRTICVVPGRPYTSRYHLTERVVWSLFLIMSFIVPIVIIERLKSHT